ncbi:MULTISPECIES: sigma factor [unclassified Frankia]|uniref:sigma factor n=2 Tax=unclassified Frankia TaxID=2632575 RepID=UPI001EF74C31|nr:MULTISPECIES: sigma factor [unclassified Frankia]
MLRRVARAMREMQVTVAAAAAGDERALDQLVEAYLPLVYNIVGWAMTAHADVDDVVQETMLQVIRGLPGLRDAQRFHPWLIAITMRQVRGRWRAPADTAELLDVAGPGADFVDLAIAGLQLTGQRRELAEAARWLDGDDVELLSLWWLESAGQFTCGELADALRLSTPDLTLRVRRMCAQLDAARAMIRALHATARCSVLDELLLGWEGRPSSLWRERLARHTRECLECDRWCAELVPTERLLVGAMLVPVPAGLTAKVLGQPGGGIVGGGGDNASARSGSTTDAALLRAQPRGMALSRRRAVAVIGVAAAGGVAAVTAAVLSGRREKVPGFVTTGTAPTGAAADTAVPTSGASASGSATPSRSPSPKAADPGADPGVDPVFIGDPDLNRSETYRYQVTKPGDHTLPAGTVAVQYDVSKAAASPLKGQLAQIRDRLARGSGLALYLTGGTALNDTDLTALQTLHKPETSGGLDLTNLRRLHVYNLRSLQGGRECTPTSGLACAGQTARGGDWPYLWYNGWWDTWVKDLVLDDLDEVKDGTFSNHNFASVSLRGARTVGVMAFGHAPYARLAVVYLPSAITIGRDAFRRNQYLLKVNLPRAVTVGDFAFDDTSRLQYFAAPNLESIGRNGLNDTHALRAVHLPSLTYMGINCFDLNGDAAQGTGVKVLRLPKLQTLDKNAITGFATLQQVWAPMLTTAWHYSITNNPKLLSVYAPGLRKLGPHVFTNNVALRAVYLGTQPPAQDPTAFTGTDAAKLTLYHPPGKAAWRAFRPAGNPALRVVEQ